MNNLQDFYILKGKEVVKRFPDIYSYDDLITIEQAARIASLADSPAHAAAAIRAISKGAGK